jgi:hypothetical protein
MSSQWAVYMWMDDKGMWVFFCIANSYDQKERAKTKIRRMNMHYFTHMLTPYPEMMADM